MIISILVGTVVCVSSGFALASVDRNLGESQLEVLGQKLSLSELAAKGLIKWNAENSVWVLDSQKLKAITDEENGKDDSTPFDSNEVFDGKSLSPDSIGNW